MIEEDGYLVIRKAIPSEVLDFVVEELNIIYEVSKNSNESRQDPQVVGAVSLYGTSTTETLMLKLLPTIEEATGLELYPTYSYMRYYSLGQEMAKHLDRPSCEYSITANLWNEKEPWPIWFTHPKGYPAQVDLHPGDIIIYKGCEIEHWREVNTVGKSIQTFLHYVNKNGPNAEWAYDKRELGEIYGDTRFSR